MESINTLVGYDNLVIYQNDDWFKFSLESVLLPSFVVINKNVDKILDLCSGNAPIPILLSTKTNKKIIGVEIQKDLCDLANKSIKANRLEKQIEIINDDLNNIFNLYESDYFDIITCNPPYIGYEEEIMDLVKNNEPHLALYAKDDGLYFYKLIFEEIKSHLNDKYLLLFELNSEKSKEIYSLAKESFDSSEISIIKDLGNRDRVLIVNHN